MFAIYGLLISIVGFFIRVVAFFNPKMRLFVDGRKSVFETLSRSISADEKTIWFHCASLGEYEQGLPVMEAMRSRFPEHKIVLTFFSPSGYEVRKNNAVADVTIYLPIDTVSNARRFLDIVHPELAFMIKYEFWPNYLNELDKRNVRTFLISGIFRENQAFFKWYGGFYRKALDTFEHFFVQNSRSKDLLASLKKYNATVSGDTRFDRVAAILEKNNTLGFISEFKNGAATVVVGSSWPKDETLLADFINKTDQNVKFIIAPHNIKEAQIAEIRNSITRKVVLFSEKEGKNLADFDVFIIDTIGILTKIYSYADIAYVGGGFGNPGVHNILEPATFGVPIVIGPNYSHFAEAIALVDMEGCISVDGQAQLKEAFDLLLSNDDIRHEKGHICATFVQMNKNATSTIMKHFDTYGDV
ncbi:3-deoxy-D-manno-octulosonic acid transferase [Flavobacterium selenitireducens]|uniref:3-deoxy-D-manno-octulosonic acid transferase n=1 Tax=Flavobacterium selenitireducens TaxID=2722704 RepID=UPI00168B7133|nr:glycosyltransferase N-terminal domain-containing protein [Flavobacterium selenitireducens]MBD3583888.1 3-deoxy-D-manno-octulosonic acid transferase [Flavobacterium selenitireducens]